jgi:hypothetical protein
LGNPHFKYQFFIASGLFLLIVFSYKPLKAQAFSDDLFLLQGKILSSDSLLPLENAHIISKFNQWGTISDEKGDFVMLVNKNDSLLITSVGFGALILHLDDSVQTAGSPLRIYMAKDTIMINEFIVYAFWDYTTFKQMIINMKPIDFDFSRLDFEENLMLALPSAQSGLSPVQALYNRFNKSERLKRHLLKNRKRYNELMIDMGRPQDTIPAIPEHMQELPHSP